MTDYQFRSLILMILAIMKKSDSLEEAILEIEALTPKENE